MKSRWRSRSNTLARLGLAGLLLTGSRSFAQDPSYKPPPLFTWRDGVLALGFVAGTALARPIDKQSAISLQRPGYQQKWIFQEGAKIVRTIAVPGSTVIGVAMYATGRLTKSEKLAEVGLRGTEALVIGVGVGSVLKDFLGRARPFVDTVSPNPDDWQLLRGFKGGENYRSFPSGHTVAAFAAAAAVSAETSRWWPQVTYFGIGPVLYGGATLVGLSRMYNNRHWASDVITGAAIGTFAGTKVVRYHRTHPGNRIDKWLLNVSMSADLSPHLSLSPAPPRR